MQTNMFKYILAICIISNTLLLTSQTPPWYFAITNCNQSNIVMDTAFKYSLLKFLALLIEPLKQISVLMYEKPTQKYLF